MRTLTVALFAALIALPAYAAKMAGVSFPDSQSVGGSELVLNGLGLREATLGIDVYVAGLYLPSKTNDAGTVLSKDTPKHLKMHFVIDSLMKKKVSQEDQVGAWTDGFKNNGVDINKIKSEADQLFGWMTEMRKGDTMAFTYVPGEGTTVMVKGQKKGTIPGDYFQEAVFKSFVGPKPPNEGLKTGLLGR
ncbi:MAG: chalcone isomerase family protein [Myxococcota bacterium]